MDIQNQIEYYNAEWGIVDRIYANALQLSRTIEILRELLQTGAVQTGAIPPKICDLGSGTGWLTAILGCVGEATGVELSNVAVENARKRFSHAKFECADVIEWEYPREVFDVVVSHEVIEHIEDQQRYVDIANGLLKPGGWLILTTPNAPTVHATPGELHSKQPIENVLDANQLRRLLETRFENVRIRSIILGGGTRGVYRIVNSRKAHNLLARVGLDALFTGLALRAGLGLHLIARAQKPNEAARTG
ncbi:MAG TPA: class I SAM-dependent methyltransferase [Candidatus Aquilonibacter sp.]